MIPPFDHLSTFGVWALQAFVGALFCSMALNVASWDGLSTILIGALDFYIVAHVDDEPGGLAVGQDECSAGRAVVTVAIMTAGAMLL